MAKKDGDGKAKGGSKAGVVRIFKAELMAPNGSVDEVALVKATSKAKAREFVLQRRVVILPVSAMEVARLMSMGIPVEEGEETGSQGKPPVAAADPDGTPELQLAERG